MKLMHEIVIFVAKYFVLISVIVTAYVWWKLPALSQKKRFIAEAILGAVLSLLIAKIGSKLYTDPRPFVVGHFTPYFSHANDNGFPSDHTLFTSFMAFLLLHYNRRAGVGLIVIAALVGLSRVIAGVHHVVDIVGAFICSFAGIAIAAFAVNRLAQSRAHVHPGERTKE